MTAVRPFETSGPVTSSHPSCENISLSVIEMRILTCTVLILVSVMAKVYFGYLSNVKGLQNSTWFMCMPWLHPNNNNRILSLGYSFWNISHIKKTNREYKTHFLAISVNIHCTAMFYSILFLICSHIPPLGDKMFDLGSNKMGIGVFLLTLNWYFERRETNPTLVCISPNRIPEK